MSETPDSEYTDVSVPDEQLPEDLQPGEDNPLAGRRWGVYKGRKPKIDPAEVRRLHFEERLSPTAIAKQLGIARSSVYRFLPASRQPVAQELTSPNRREAQNPEA